MKEPSLAPPAPSGPMKEPSLAPPAPSGGAWGDASPQTPAIRTSRVSWGLEMAQPPRPPAAPTSGCQSASVHDHAHQRRGARYSYRAH